MTGFTSIPVIDVADLMRDGADRSPRTALAIEQAAQNVGFFSIVGHGCPSELIRGLLAQTKRFFDQALDQKMAVYIGKSRNHRGYVPAGEEVFAGGGVDKKEAFDLAIDLDPGDPDAARYPLLGPNQWPALSGFSRDVMAYYDAVFSIGRRLCQSFALALGKPSTFFDPCLTKPPSQLRLIHYPFDPDASDAPGIGAHTDYECFTLLYATGPGLEVMNGDGDWIDAPPVPDGFMINVGDLMELLSDGRFVATSHRVRKVREERYSFPLFFNLDYPTEVTPLGDARSDRSSLIAGEHLYAQTAQTFRYLQQRLQRGEITLPDSARKLSSFGQEARRPGLGQN
jgi:isopenicillin N synthase-like dioxygenase